MKKKLVHSNKDFDEEYKNVVDDIKNLDYFEDIQFPTLDMIEETKKILISEVEKVEPQKNRKDKRNLTNLLVASVLFVAILGELAVLRPSLFNLFNRESNVSAKNSNNADDTYAKIDDGYSKVSKAEMANESILSVYGKNVEEFAMRKGYVIVKNSVINMHIRIPNFEERAGDIPIGDIFKQRNELSKKNGYNFEAYKGKRVVLYAANVKKNNKLEGLLITLIYSNKIIGAWISENGDLENILKTQSADDEAGYLPISTDTATEKAKNFIKKYYSSDEQVKSFGINSRTQDYNRPYYTVTFDSYIIRIDALSGQVIELALTKGLKSDDSLKDLTEEQLKERAIGYYKELGFQYNIEDVSYPGTPNKEFVAQFCQSIAINNKVIYSRDNSVQVVVSSKGQLERITSFYRPLIYNGKSNTNIDERHAYTIAEGYFRALGIYGCKDISLESIVPNNNYDILSKTKKGDTAKGDSIYPRSEAYSKLVWSVTSSDKDQVTIYLDAETGEILGAN
ncbi:DUF4830 domain-containing protein [Clostridium manihotivorum]|uniref:PepSY domain-containing protein n=1 Tax=Clostridium manihotivorum TaxID=2320868 RepID=A0A3R5TJU9_9CLOT|nr:DUF4830 domain-containing protein [Clostridium manihotivorum]QAA35130.1 hypothetical protein C1I91_27740 [Clostridium manihotivorum]